jgi:hypothetical protein
MIDYKKNSLELILQILFLNLNYFLNFNHQTKRLFQILLKRNLTIDILQIFVA